MALSDQAKAAMRYWGAIQASVTDRASTADTWAAINARRESLPEGTPGPTLQGVNELRSLAAQSRNSSYALSRARDTEESSGLAQTITGQMMAVAPWSADQGVLSTLADYQVRFEAQFIDPLGRAASVTLTALYPNGTLPTTVGELVESLAAWAPASGSMPVGAFDGIGDINIQAV